MFSIIGSKRILILGALILFSAKTLAYDRIDKTEDDEKSTKKTFEQQFLDSNIAISKWLIGVTDNIDLFLVDKQRQSARNDTSVKITNSTFSTEGNDVSNQTTLTLSPRFPNLEKYWNLKFTSYDEQSDERRSENAVLRKLPRETNYGATIGLFKNIGKIRTIFQPRIELQNPLKISHSLAFETTLANDSFQINPKIDFFANATKGTGIFQALNFNFILTKTISLVLINEGTYEEKLHKYSVTNGVSVGKTVSETDALTSSLLFFSNNRDNYHMDSYSVSASWYHLFYKKILDLQLSPHLNFTRDRDFTGQAGLTLQLSLNF